MRTTKELQRDVLMHLSRRWNRSLTRPDRVSVNLTLRCNLSCTMCTTCYPAPELCTEEVKSLIDQTSAWGVEVFNPLGGEPFMRGDIEEILDYAVRRGFYVTVTTNGTLITKPRAQRIATVPSDRLHFIFSIDGDETTHDAIRGNGNWKRTIQGFERVRDADAEMGNARRKILANAILHAQNLASFEDVLDDLKARGFDGVQVLTLFRSDQTHGDDPAEAMRLLPRHHDAVETLAHRLAERAERQDSNGFQIQNQPAELRRIPEFHKRTLTPLEAPCWAGWKELYIHSDGRAIMCDGNLDFLNGSFGDVRRQTLRELWQSPELKARRSVVKSCSTPCIQDCYLRPESDSSPKIAQTLGHKALQGFAHRAKGWFPSERSFPDSTLLLELSDVCPCGDPQCPTPSSRWQDLVENSRLAPTASNWNECRDRGYLDFGRGFMGFEVVKQITKDLKTSKLRFGTLSLTWRGDPLLHPEFDAIMCHLFDQVKRGSLAERLSIATTGSHWRSGMASLMQNPVPQHWIVVGDHIPETMKTTANATTTISHRPDAPLPRLAWPHPAIVSWDGKITMDADDFHLQKTQGQVTPGRLSECWLHHQR